MDKYLVFGLIILSLQDIIYGNGNGDNKTYVYVDEHETVTLHCGRHKAIWWGPINLTIYVSGGKINKDLTNYKRLAFKNNHTANTSELQIREFSKEDEGLYRCTYQNNGSYSMIEETVLIKRDPKNITIFETDNNIMFAISNQQINLTCNVETGIPTETIIWITNETELARGGPSSLTYTFTPGHEDHLQKFSCMVLTGSTSLAKSVQLFLYFPPTVHILQGNSVNIVENTSLDLRCNYTSNNVIKDIIWQYRNKSITNSTQLHFESISREQKGEYCCTVVNLAASVTANVTIGVLYPPRVTVSFSNKDGKRTLKCHPDGFPDRYDFMKWEHTTELKEHVRFLPSTKSGIITIPNITEETDRHYDRGIYICYVSNNISVDGRKFVSAKYLLNSTGKPYFVTSNHATQYSILNKSTVLTVDIVTFEKLINAALFADEMKICDFSSIQSPVPVRDTMYGNTVIVHGSTLMFPITTKTAHDFRQYTVVVDNTKGSSSYLITLKPASKPAPPSSLHFISGQTEIEISWTPGFNGGYQQQFFVEYRTSHDESWNTRNASDGTACTTTTFVNNLEPETEYFIRMYSKNRINISNYTRTYIVQTEKDTSSGLITAVSLVFIAMIVISILVYQYKTGKLKDIRQISCFRFMQVIGGGIGGVENDIYEMQNNMQQQQQQPVAEIPEVPVYSSIDRRHHLSIGSAVSYSVATKKNPNPLACRMPLTGAEHNKTNNAGMSTSKENEKEELNYIEVCFDQKPQNPFKIHGLELRSDYVEVDFTKKVDPLPDSDNDDASDDDFVSLEDVKSMKRKTLAQM